MGYQDCAHYLPHRESMLLLDEVLSVAGGECVCKSTVSPKCRLAMFLDDAGALPGAAGMELLCQCVGVYSGVCRERLGLTAVKLGMVLSCRGYASDLEVFPAGSVLEIRVRELMNDGSVGSFQGEILIDGNLAAGGTVSVYQPSDPELESLFDR